MECERTAHSSICYRSTYIKVVMLISTPCCIDKWSQDFESREQFISLLVLDLTQPYLVLFLRERERWRSWVFPRVEFHKIVMIPPGKCWWTVGIKLDWTLRSTIIKTKRGGGRSINQQVLIWSDQKENLTSVNKEETQRKEILIVVTRSIYPVKTFGYANPPPPKTLHSF